MSTLDINTSLHKLIDKIDNEVVLSRFYEILEKASTIKDGSLRNKLTDEESQEFLLIDTETDDEDNLISMETLKEKHEKWLK
ncbi:MAG: hypothetical protein RBS23_06835 [Mariniphaga sp.]|nr:hypothetical protein [Mariniphaga sp.]MDY0143904.1 hypothetical protein [Bacteroidales bacterium]